MVFLSKARASRHGSTLENPIWCPAGSSGLQILRVDDYATADFVEIGSFDTYPKDDSSDFAGAWSVYPYFRSGLIAVSSIEEGLFLVKRAESRRRLRGARV